MTRRMTMDAKKESKPLKPVAKSTVGVTHDKKFESKPVVNFMNGISYSLDPIATLRLVTASSIFGEPAYYESKNTRARNMEQAIDNALDYDFEATMKFAMELRLKFWMRLNPAIILVRAAVHPKRAEYTANNPGGFSEVISAIALRPDDLTSQVEYYLTNFEDRKSGSKASRMPGVLKRAIAKRLGEFNRYQIAKYAERGIGLIDVVRLTHAHSDVIAELIKTGKVVVEDTDKTWRILRSAGKTWREILESGITLSHDDLLYQLRSIMTDIPESDTQTAAKVLGRLIHGVEKGRLFPYKYWVAYKTIQTVGINHKRAVLDALQICIDKAIANQPKLRGTVACLSDNSGSARSGIVFEGSNVSVYEVGNLSAVMTAMNCDRGFVGIFGDKLAMTEASKREGALTQVNEVNNVGEEIGHGTENGIWLFWRDAIAKKIHYDTVFVYSDMQAGTGGLYGVHPSDYKEYQYSGKSQFIDMWKLVNTYRQQVNAKVNVFSVQIAGYDNTLVPENQYRGANLTGFTGKEVAFAAEIINIWDQAEQ